ncbi:hypothetical protein Sta7437_3757 [Stanieria cyanosphaera PCC 7437]|uniref:Uncharacterized protein n=1 Tax=Stanieria cyanosphaera (strain ATCC 29371 / PCC 7437) TaxID=111780 RepID=K9XZY4_STAC7|nr:DUF5331 domain-containing protein [Stanieria cyanosphaera]AFZ37252.1 hypothetical protein Sta7437_3757 [Stanieria cyanosphaera PCC 7437]
MADILAQPEQFKAELKEKWLNYYQENRSWLQQCMNENSGWCDCVEYEEEELKSFEVEEDYCPRRPECYFILGVVSVLEPSVRGLFTFMEYSTGSSEQLVNALGLDFDPELELKKRPQQEKTASEYLDQIREEIKT